MKTEDIIEAIDDAIYGWRLHENKGQDVDPADVVASIVRNLLYKAKEDAPK